MSEPRGRSDPETPHADEVQSAEAEVRAEESPEDDTGVRVVDRRWWARTEDSGEGDPSNRDPAKPSYVADLEKQLADQDKLLKDYAAKYRAATSEFDRTRDRLRKEVGKDVEREKRKILTAFLEIVDNLDRALQASREASGDDPGLSSLREGVEMVRQQFLSTLGRYGVTTIDASGQAFDPHRHDAVCTVPVTEADRDNLVIDVVKPGYQVHDDVLRPASVTVGKLAQAPE